MNTSFTFSLHRLFHPEMAKMRQKDCNFVVLRHLIAIFYNLPFITKLPISSTKHAIPTTKRPCFSFSGTISTLKNPKNQQKSKKSLNHNGHIVKNKTRRNYNLNTVNKIERPKLNQHYEILNNNTFATSDKSLFCCEESAILTSLRRSMRVIASC